VYFARTTRASVTRLGDGTGVQAWGKWRCGASEKYEAEVAAGIASRTNRRSSGCPLGFNEAVEAEINAVFEANDITTYREAADQCGIPKSTLHKYATKDMDFRCLGQIVRPPRPCGRVLRAAPRAARNF